MSERSIDKSRVECTYDVLSKYRGVLMGIAIIGIMVFHYTEDRYAQEMLIEWELRYYTYTRSSFVDVFLLLSGFGLYFSMKRNPDIESFYKKNFIKVLIPYVLISVPAWAYLDLYLNHSGIIAFFKDVFFVTFFQEGTKWFWYILMICFCYAIFPYIFKVFESARDQITEQMYMMGLFTFFTTICLMLQMNQTAFYDNIKTALIRLPVFCFGCLIGKAAYERRSVHKLLWAVATVVSFLMLPLVENAKLIFVYYVCASFTICLCIWLVLGLNQLSTLRYAKGIHNAVKCFFSWIGRYTLELYLVHVALRKIMKLLGYHTAHRRWTLLMWVISFVIAIVVHKLANYIISLTTHRKHSPS